MEQLNSTVVISNTSSSAGHSPPHHSLILVPVVLLSICVFLGVPGNIAVVILRPNRQHLCSLSQSLMVNLAVADLLSLLILPLRIYSLLHGWIFSLVGCKLLVSLVHCCVHASMLTVTALSVQRYLVVVHSQRYEVGTKRLLVLLWLVAMVLSIPSSVVRQLGPVRNRTQCIAYYSSEAQQVTILLTETVVGCAAFSVVVFSYISLHRKVNQGVLFNNPQTTRVVTSIIVTFFVMWAPYEITNMLGVAAIFLDNEDLLKFCTSAWTITAALTFVNSCLNPLLYAFAAHNRCTVCKIKTEQRS